MARILIAGCGDIGTAVGSRLTALGHRVVGLCRGRPRDELPFELVAVDLAEEHAVAAMDADFDHVLCCLAPDGRSERDYRRVFETAVGNLLTRLRSERPTASVTFVSSTRVYGQSDGEWVDEGSLAEAEDFRGRYQRLAEERCLEHGPETTIVRFSGIYGRSLGRLVRHAREGAEIQADPPLYSNRIHREDCIRALGFLVGKKVAGGLVPPIILASDDDPATVWDVTSWLARRLGNPSRLVPVRKPRASRNKRCRNTLLKELGFRFAFPSFREGYEEILGRCGE